MVDIKRILVTGSRGQLGKEFHRASSSFPEYEWYFLDRSSLDITSDIAVKGVLENLDPDICINCAAYTKVDNAESHREIALAVNAEGPKILAKQCEENNCRLIHFSTDYVYNIREQIPITEDSECAPLSFYGLSKLKGDQAIQSASIPWLIFRVSWLYSAFGSNFVKSMIKLGREKKEIKVVNDQIGSPTFAGDLVAAVMTSLRLNLKYWNEIYHFCNRGQVSWFDFAQEIFRAKKYNCSLTPISSKEFGAPAIRPSWSVLSTGKIEETTNIEVVNWEKSLKSCIEELTLLS